MSPPPQHPRSPHQSEVLVCRLPAELEQELHKQPQRTCIVKMMSTRNLWKNIVVLCVNS